MIKRTTQWVMFIFLLVSANVFANDALRVKALFLYNFANFVEWPEDAFANSTAPLRLCVFGKVQFGAFLKTVDGTLIGNHPLQITQTSQLAEIESGCHILFVAREQRVKLPQFFSQIKYMYVLSVGDRKGFADKGGIINIVRTADQMQFEINLATAMANGLLISSDLLSLAREVKRLDNGGIP